MTGRHAAPEPDPNPAPAPDLDSNPGGSYLPAGYVQSLIRTFVPIIVGSAGAWAAVRLHIAAGPSYGPAISSTLTTLLTALCVAGYYALCRALEKRWPRLGAALISFGLVQSKPIYAEPTDAVRIFDTRTGEVQRLNPIRRADR